MNYFKNISQFLLVFFSILIYSQNQTSDNLRGDFTYILRTKLHSDQVSQELFSLQIGNNRSFFVSNKSLEKDSIMQIVAKKAKNHGGSSFDFRGMSIPKTKFPYTILQSSDRIEYFQRVGMPLLVYKENPIRNWKLFDESQVINSINCKKASVNYKGRNWIAWYSTEIPLPYGPYKFGGLPGLIVKITDQNGDFEYELVKSVSNSDLDGQFVKISGNRYKNAIETSREKFDLAIDNFKQNPFGTFVNSGTTIIQGQDIVQQRERDKQRSRNEDNTIELSE